jgi:hypothetical protein
MNCYECKKKIKDFLDDSLNSKNTIEFVNHVRSCKECMEELSIEYLVSEGLKRLDTATSFNLDNELNDKLNEALAKAKFNRYFAAICGIVIFIVAFLLGLLLSTLFTY